MNEHLAKLAQAMREELQAIPEAMRQDEVARGAVICLLSNALRQMGLIPVPAWKPPKSTRDRVDLVGVKPDTYPPEIGMAFMVDSLVELPKVRALAWVECPEKIVVTFSLRADKVKQSTFFLSPDLVHLNIYPA